jgi:hypothetical protein
MLHSQENEYGRTGQYGRIWFPRPPYMGVSRPEDSQGHDTNRYDRERNM